MTRKQQPWFIAACVAIALLLSGCLARCQTRADTLVPECLLAQAVVDSLREQKPDILQVLTGGAKSAFLASQERADVEVPDEVKDADTLIVAVTGTMGIIVPTKEGCVLQGVTGVGPANLVKGHLGERI